MRPRCTYVRHAESSPDPNDHTRPLTPFGAKAARALGDRVRSIFGTPDLIISSDAKRARSTAELLDLGRVLIKPELYLASADFLTRFTQSLPQVEHVLVVAHNPGLAELLCRHAPKMEHVPPASGFQLIWEVDDWLLTGVEPPSGCRQFSASGVSDS